jgi:hypothetical protein
MPAYSCPTCGKKILVSNDEHRRVGLKRVTEHIRSHGEVKDVGNDSTESGRHVPTTEPDTGSTSNGNELESRRLHVVPDSV